MRIAVCDDNRDFRRQILDILDGIVKDGDTVSEFDGGEQLLSFCRPDYPFDLTLLDIKMPYLDGGAVARKIREIAPDAVVVILTSYREHAIDFYQYRAFDYLLKPVSPTRLRQTVEDARCEITKQKVLIIKNRQGFTRLPIKYIYYLEISGRTLGVYSSQGFFEYTGSMTDAIAELTPRGFYPINRSQLLNLDYVDRVKSSCFKVYLTNGDTLKISESRVSDFMKTMIDYIDAVNKGPDA